MVKPRDWKVCTDAEISDGVFSLKRELFALQTEYRFSRKVEKPHQLRSLRRDIARALTESRARQLKEKRAQLMGES